MVAFKIALRFLTSRKSQTVLIVLGLAIAISVQLFVGILISSLQVGLVDAVTGTAPHITIESNVDGQGIDEWNTIVTDIRGMEGVTGVTASAFSYTLVSYQNRNISSGIKGLELASANLMYDIPGSLIDGSMPSASDQVLVGSVLNSELLVPVDSTISVVNWDGTSTILTVSGIYKSGNSFTDNQIITNLDKCQDIFNLGDSVDAIEIQIDDVFMADTISLSITNQLNDATLKTTNWKENSEDLLNALQSQSLSSYMIQAFVLISVVIAITSVLAITVLQKSKQIGILKAMGIKDRTASLIFLYQGLLLGIMGAIGGILIGLFLLYGFIFGTSSGEEEPLIKLIIDFKFIALSGTIAIISSMVASLLPAKNSSKLSPVEVIRNG
jgi:lipoprotein-releasing system permease protein